MTQPMTLQPNAARHTSLHVGLLAALCLVVFLPGIASLPLMDPEEPRCALIAREMVEFGDWLVMHLEGEPYYDKPAPYFWLTAVATKLTGSAELGGRSVSVLAALGAVLTTYFLTRRIFGPRAGLIAAGILATSGEFAFIARWYRMEMPYAAAMWGALLCFWEMERGAETERPAGGRHWWLGFYGLCGVATLFKGPVGLGLPLLVTLVYLLLSGRPRRVLEVFHWPGILLYVVIAAPWYVAVSLRDPQYAYQFFVVQNVERFGGPVKDDIFYATYLPVLLIGVAPWTVWLAETLARMWPRPWRERMSTPGVLFLYVALVVPFVFFSLSGTKLVHYILPVFPPAAVLMGALAERFLVSERFSRWDLVGLLGVPSAIAVCLVVLGCFTDDLDAWLAVPIGAAAAAAAIIVVSYRRNARLAALATTFAVVVVMYLFMTFDDALGVYENRSTRDLAAQVTVEDRAQGRFMVLGRPTMSFEYYARVEVDHVHTDEIQRLIKAVTGAERVFVLVEKSKPDGWDRLGYLQSVARDRVHVIGQNRHYWLVSNLPRKEAEGE